MQPYGMDSLQQLYTLTPSNQGPDRETYGDFVGPVAVDRLAMYLPKGSLVAVRPYPGSRWQPVAAAIEVAANRVVNSAVVLWPDCIGRRAAIRFAVLAGLLGIRTVVWQRAPPTGTLREQLTDPTDWPAAMLGWVRSRGVNVPAEITAILEILARHAPQYRTLSALAAEHGLSTRRCRRAFAVAGLATPGRWHAMLRAVGIALKIQRAPERRIADFAREFGFSGPTALSDRLNEVIGARPAFIRRRLGGQWMLADAAKRLKVL